MSFSFMINLFVIRRGRRSGLRPGVLRWLPRCVVCVGSRVEEYKLGKVGSEVRLVYRVLEHAPRVGLGCLEARWLFDFGGCITNDVMSKHSIMMNEVFSS
jgi:hypothetical protein